MTTANESFEKAAAVFRKASGHLAPGKDGCSYNPECMRDWKIWCAAIEYMKSCKEDGDDKD